MWIVMTSPRKNRYANVALVRLTPEYAEAGQRPVMISDGAQGAAEVRHRGYHYVGNTGRSAFHSALARAQADAKRLNNENNEPSYGPDWIS
jgi:hypothetical protein